MMSTAASPNFFRRSATTLAMAGIFGLGSINCAAAGTGAIAWNVVSSDSEVDKAFALARKANKPVFLYWGAVWCPPCNQVKATLFSRPDFVERSRAFVPVYIDGDRPGAQKVAARFKVQGYPTMILFKPDGTEITRLPGEVDPQRYLLTLTAGLDAQVSVKDLVGRAIGGQTVSKEQWQLLAFYSWDTDEQQVLPAVELPTKLKAMADAAPAELPEVKHRLLLKAIAAAANSSSGRVIDIGSSMSFIDYTLSDEVLSRRLSDLLIGQGEAIVQYLAPAGDVRKQLAQKWDNALSRLMNDPSISKADRVEALGTKVALWKLTDIGQRVDPHRQAMVMREIAKVVAATSDRYERQAVVPSAAHVLAEAGLLPQSNELLTLELPRAVAPYYHMLGLAGNAKKQGDYATALKWYERAWRRSEGAATRIQWGAGFVGQLTELVPNDRRRIEMAAADLIGQLEPKGETFYERNQRSLKRMAERLTKWADGDQPRSVVVRRLQDQLTRKCVQISARDFGRANCSNVFRSSERT